jgi:hypothetical protein
LNFLGVGIPGKHIPNLFNRFYRVESRQSRSHEGTGIGLALIKELVNRHGGDIFVESVVDKGSTFKVLLPTGWEHLPPQQVYFDDEDKVYEQGQQLYSSRDLYLEESSQWIQRNQVEESDDISEKDMDIDDNSNVLSIDFSSTLEMDNIKKKTDDQYTFPFSLEDDPLTPGNKFRVLIVDDNTDMR